jgi:hypothetical protein
MAISLRFRRAGGIFLLLFAGFLLDWDGPSAGRDCGWHPIESAGTAASGAGASTVDFDGGSDFDQEDAEISTLPGLRCGLDPRWSVANNEELAVSREGIDIFHPPLA